MCLLWKALFASYLPMFKKILAFVVVYKFAVRLDVALFSFSVIV